ncbi:hypothetical protein [Vibrio phage vB_VibM_10AMN]|uniref:Uncharacterized protein n=1 Tax=Staphylococcus phage vB_VibM_10AMN12 TaxID=3076785 RepID=A0AA96KSI9_9CAUD|nr:hypothetical protein [Vibrio phage vB_VibM_10AMN]WNO47447.1 hypothetical protein [Staphylococcus phage vB_VibM_10AMN12]
MAFIEKVFVYDKKITVGDKNNWIKLSVTSKGKDIPVCALSSSSCKFSTLNVPYTLFSDMYEDCLTTNSYVCQDLDEVTTLTRDGVTWTVTQSWGDEVCCTEISHKDMLKLIQHCSKYFQIKRACDRKFSAPVHKKILKLMVNIYNLPLKLIRIK